MMAAMARVVGMAPSFPGQKRSPPAILAILAILAVATIARADESGYIVLQSGTPDGGTPLHDRGLYGQGQVIAIMDTGLDWDSCYFSELDGSRPPINLTIDGRSVDTSRRKVIAYDFLWSCAEHPGAFGCESPDDPAAYDNQGHGTHAAAGAAADRDRPLLHDYADGIASGAKLVVQDGGYTGGDDCAQRPGFGCPLRDLRPVLQQAYDQGARIHSNSWGDRQGVPGSEVPPTGNYSTGSRDIDDFVWTHPDMVVVFNTGNAGALGASSQSSPGNAKNTIQVGGAAIGTTGTVVGYSGIGPTRDGRIKPDLVGPVDVVGADTDGSVATANCDYSTQGGTSFASPPVAGAAALVRQYFMEGWYPSGAPDSSDVLDPSAALVKAVLVASARRVSRWDNGTQVVIISGVPSYEQGFGFPALDDALYFPGNRSRLVVVDRDLSRGLAQGESFELDVGVQSANPLRVALVWTDPPGTPAGITSTTPQLVNDLDLVVSEPGGVEHFGNERLHPAQRDSVNNAEIVRVDAPATGTWRVKVNATKLGLGPRQSFALVVVGDVRQQPARLRPVRRGVP